MSEKLPEGWKIATLEDIARVTSGGTPSRKKSSYWNGCIPWVTTGEILFNTITQTNEYITELGMLNSSAKIFPEGTLLIAMYGQGKTRGSVARLGISAATNQACAVILLSDSQDSYFHFYNFQNKYNNIRNISNTSSQKNLSLELIKKQKIIFPPIFEQKK
ncbi:restriction endonuclease subunit S [Desulfovibrio sp. 6_1_46AFAA]|uniref:restriction endonuclease subunit S n=1 Tax=Desulfovibrio sp. 6_1_46AFAA TaxID=665942 RepID=UPI000A02AF2F|nr:restriction endonuclease subunit S [Desulfovibrio sp. 6_1_46AFAA]